MICSFFDIINSYVCRKCGLIMKKKLILIGLIIILVIGMAVFLMIKEKKYSYEDENTLYYIELNNVILRFERYDYSLNQNQVIGVQKSVNKGKTFENITEENIIVSMESKFTFLNEKLGFVISTSNLTKNNDYMGIKVTQDGGKSFIDVKINYDNPNIEILTVEDVPYYENDELKLKCSIYQVKDDLTGYEDVELILVSTDNGLTWNLSNNAISMMIKENTLTDSGMTVIIKNNSSQTYHYGMQYSLEKYENEEFITYEPKEPLSWTYMLYHINSNEEKEEIFDWSYGYGKLESGKYRLVRYFTSDDNMTSSANVSEKYYVEFEIK